jgi:hypothetical protein
MITNIRLVSAADLSVSNEVMNFNRRELHGSTLAGAAWIIDGATPRDALLSTLKLAYNSISKKLPDHVIWLLIGSSAWEPDTRIVRYRKLSGALAGRGIKISHASDWQEIMLESAGKIKFFGAMRLSELSVNSVVHTLLEEHCTYLVALPYDRPPQGVLEIGWSGNLAEDYDTVIYVSTLGGLLLKSVGEFDDNERGVVAIGQPGLVTALLS